MKVHRTGNSTIDTTSASDRTKKKKEPLPEEKQTFRSSIIQDHIKSLEEKPDTHKQFHKERTVDKLHIDIRGKSAKVMHLTEALYGHMFTDNEFIERIFSHLEELPSKERPDVVIVSGLLFGGYQHREKNARRVKTMSVDNQFAKAKKFIERLQSMGLTVIYNLSDNDQKIIEDYTYDAVRIMQGNPRQRGDDRPTSVAAFDNAQQLNLWQRNYDFQWDVVDEYMLRCGRTLRTREEVRNLIAELPAGIRAELATDYRDEVDNGIEECLLLWDAHGRLEREEELTLLQTQVLEVDNIPHSRRPADTLSVTNDYNLELETGERTTTLNGRHFFRQTPTSMVQNPTKEVEQILSQMEASGQTPPKAFVVENEQRAVGMMHDNTFITSTPGLTTYNPDMSSYTGVQIDKARRISLARREFNIAGAQQIEFSDDGRIFVHLLNDHLMSIASKTEEPHAAIFFSDWQTGSVTARPDLAVKAMDYVLHSVLKKQKGMLFMNGDIIQGRNYAQMPNENPNMGLIAIDAQQEFVYTMLREILERMPKVAKNNLQGVHITPGNHEWNSGHERHGSTHSMFLKILFNEASERTFRTYLHSYDTVRAGTSHFKSFTAIDKLAEFKILAQHIMMERGGKGSGELPINQFFEMIRSSSGPLMKELDLMGAGHYHHPSYMMTNNKIGVINGSLAGLSGYEWWRGYNPVIGTTIVHLGGNKPPVIEFLTPEFLYNYECKGAYSDANLERRGYTTDGNFDSNINGFGKLRVTTGERSERMPQSAIQKRLWDIVEEILWGSNGNLPLVS